MKNLMKKIVVLAAFLLILSPVFAVALPASAATKIPVTGWGEVGKGGVDEVQEAIGLSSKDPRSIIGAVINVLLSFLGIIAVVIILLGGFKWMTAGGSEDKIGEAKKMITAGVIGLVIILASWGIATFVLDSLVKAADTP